MKLTKTNWKKNNNKNIKKKERKQNTVDYYCNLQCNEYWVNIGFL